MKEYQSDKLRSVSLISHGGAGKTSLAEAILFTAGAVTRLGRVDEGNSTTDYEPEEIKRKVTISTALAPCEWQGGKITFLDTPGYADFVADVKGALRAVDAAVVVLCAASGVEVDTEKVWRFAGSEGLPRLLFVNKMDRENADFAGAVAEIKEKLSQRAIPLFWPIGAEDEFSGIIDVLSGKAYLLVEGKLTEGPVPVALASVLEDVRQGALETIAETDDALLNKYLEGTELTSEELYGALQRGIAKAELFPIFCGSAQRNMGVQQLLDGITTYVPAGVQRSVLGTDPRNEEPVERVANDPFSALVFKTTADPFVGRLSFLRVFSGSLKPDSTLYNASKEKSERIGNIFTMRGKQQEQLTTAYAGDIVVVAKMQETATGDSLCSKEQPILFEPIEYPKAMYTVAIAAKNKGDEDKLGGALARMRDEDPTLRTSKTGEGGQLLLSGIGELHLDIMAERMKRKFGVEVVVKTPKVPYRETIRSTVKVEGKHKKQSGGHGQYGHVWLQLDPLPPGQNFEFVDSIFGGSVPRQYVPAVEKGVRDAMMGGVLAGFPLVDVKVTLYDGSYHTVDSSEMAFKVASGMALKKGVLQAKPVLLEPICNVEVKVPENCMGDVIGDLNSKRGRVLGMEPIGQGKSLVKAQAPQAELFRYAIDLRSMTQGRGSFDMEFSHYEEVPNKLAETLNASTKKEEPVT